MTEESSARGANGRAKARDPYLDNAKVLLIVLVVVGHLLERIAYSGVADGLYTWIYSFHMPAFVFVSGYLSRRFEPTMSRSRSLITSLLVPYLVFQVVLSLEDWLLRGNHLVLDPFVPRFALWYLLALFAWRLLIPVLRSIPHPLLWSVVASVVSVVYGGLDQELSLARILSFLPYFTLGVLTTPERIEAFKDATARLRVRVPAVLLLVASLVVAYLLRDDIPRRWLYMYGQTDEVTFTNLENMVIRLAVLAMATVAMACFLAVVPRRRTFFTPLGNATLYVYLLQAAVIYPLQPLIGEWGGWTAPMVAVLVAGGVALALLLGSRPVQKLTAWVVDPVNTAARRRSGAAAGAAG
ncbi:acyltransferase family protein [Cryobacterium tepidiphilum]|uniref:Acyltransferase n=1 Tax=Cryobacterium tepidiphilum TaxID=2486026 RepID=A0A3M8L2G2_9MICO|nr:acyltransferase family protein [Cryobacterium tepidiphilum]RNE59089.1 acyltransferase [Cryobacterium tepidiphilum]